MRCAGVKHKRNAASALRTSFLYSPPVAQPASRALWALRLPELLRGGRRPTQVLPFTVIENERFIIANLMPPVKV